MPSPNSPFQDEVEHQKKAEYIVSEVLKRLDKNGDGTITLDELEAVGLEGLPNFDELGAEGHHYDVESGALADISPHSSTYRSLASFLQSSSCTTKVCCLYNTGAPRPLIPRLFPVIAE